VVNDEDNDGSVQNKNWFLVHCSLSMDRSARKIQIFQK